MLCYVYSITHPRTLGEYMGTRVYTTEEIKKLPKPEDDFAYSEMTPAQRAWAEKRQDETLLDEGGEEISEDFIIGFSVNHANFPGHLVIMITRHFDVSDHDKFLDEVDGIPVVYIRMDAPIAH